MAEAVEPINPPEVTEKPKPSLLTMFANMEKQAPKVVVKEKEPIETNTNIIEEEEKENNVENDVNNMDEENFLEEEELNEDRKNTLFSNKDTNIDDEACNTDAVKGVSKKKIRKPKQKKSPSKVVEKVEKVKVVPKRKKSEYDSLTDCSEQEDAEGAEDLDNHYYDKVIMAKLPDSSHGCKAMCSTIQAKIEHYKSLYYKEVEENKTKQSLIPSLSIPINANVTKYNFEKLAINQKKYAGKLFDVIMMDPPWQLSTSTPSRGVAIGYDS